MALAKAELAPEVEREVTGVRGRDVGTALVVVFGLLMAFTKLRGVRWLRVAFQLVLIGYLGLVNGDLLSQALLVGWAQNGLAWRFAPGLLLLVAAALLVPLVARKNVYCHQLCPHGAAQQLLKKALPKRWRIGVPARLALVLRAVPFLLVLFVIVVGVTQLTFNLVAIEPFDAYLFRVAGWATITIAVVGLVASMFVPMAYCRYGCPTGAVLNFLLGGGQAGQVFTKRRAGAGVFVVGGWSELWIAEMKRWFLWFAVLLAGCDSNSEERELVGRAMGTTWSLKYLGGELDDHVEVRLRSWRRSFRPGTRPRWSRG